MLGKSESKSESTQNSKTPLEAFWKIRSNQNQKHFTNIKRQIVYCDTPTIRLSHTTIIDCYILRLPNMVLSIQTVTLTGSQASILIAAVYVLGHHSEIFWLARTCRVI